MANCKCIPHPDDVAKYPAWKETFLKPIFSEACPEDQAASKAWCEKHVGPKGGKPGDWPLVGYPGADDTKIEITGHNWIWVDESKAGTEEGAQIMETGEGDPPPPADKTVNPPPAPPAAFTGSIPENLGDFNDQCFLLEFAEPIYKKFGPTAEFLKEVDLFKEPVRSLTWLTKNVGSEAKERGPVAWKENITYISHITAGAVPADTMRNFFELTTAEKAQLVPFIQISVDYYDSAAERKKSVILDFPNETDLDPAILQATGQRKLAGIKSVSINLDGIDAVMAKVVKVDAAFVFQDFRTIFKQQPDVRGAAGTTIRKYYSDLFSYGARDLTAEGEYANLYKKLRFKIGWSGRTHTIAGEKEAITKRLGLNERTLVLDVGIQKYDFDFNQDGSLIVRISYIGAMQDALNGPSSNLLSMVKKTMDSALQHKASATLNKTKTITKRHEEQLKEDQVKLLAILFFQQQLMQSLAKSGGAAEVFRGVATGDTAGKEGLGQVYYETKEPDAWLWEGESGLKPGGIFAMAALKGKLSAQYGDTVSEAQVGAMADTIRGIYEHTFLEKRVILDTSFQWGDMWDAESTMGETWSAGITKANFDGLIAAIGRSSKKLKAGEGFSQASGQDTKARLSESEQGIREASATAQKQILKQLSLMKFSGLRQLATQLLVDQKIYAAKLTRDDKFKLNYNSLQQEQATQVFAEMVQKADAILQPIPTSADKTAAEYQALSQEMVTYEEMMSGYMQFIPFVLLGDLLRTLLYIPTDTPTGPPVHELITQSYSEKFKVDLGYIYYTGPLTNQPVLRFPLYYLPISLKRLNNFFVRNIIGKEMTFYSFKNFVVDLLNEFLAGAQKNCLLAANSGGAIMPSLDFIFGNVLENRQWNRAGSSQRFAKGLGKSNFKTWFIYGTQAARSEIPRDNAGSYPFNMKNKIFHFYLGGQNKGIVKSVKLIDNTKPELRAAMYLKHKPKDGEVNMNNQGVLPPLVFKVEIQTIGCSTFHLGQYVFLDARQYVDTEVDRIFQITGYYRIFKVQHSAARDNFTTTITAILEESLESARRRAKQTAGEKVPLVVEGPPPPGAEVVTETTGLDPGVQKALDQTQRQIEEMAGTNEEVGDDLTAEQLAAYWSILRNGSTQNKYLSSTNVVPMGVPPVLAALGETAAALDTMGSMGDADGYVKAAANAKRIMMKMVSVKNGTRAGTVAWYLNEIIWNGAALPDGGYHSPHNQGHSLHWGSNAAGKASMLDLSHSPINVTWAQNAVEALMQLVENHPSLAADQATAFAKYKSGSWSSRWGAKDSPWYEDYNWGVGYLNVGHLFFMRKAQNHDYLMKTYEAGLGAETTTTLQKPE